MSENAQNLNIEVTDQAQAAFNTILGKEDNQGKAFRVFIAGISCGGGPTWGLSLEDPDENDEIYRGNGLTLQTEPALREQIQNGGGLVVDFAESPIYGSGFVIKFKNESQTDACGCGCGC